MAEAKARARPAPPSWLSRLCPCLGSPETASDPEATAAAAAVVSYDKPALETITIPPAGEHRATVVFLHGLGDTGDGWPRGIWAGLTAMRAREQVKWVFPSAPRAPVSCNGGRSMPSWFDVASFGERAVPPQEVQQDAQGLDRAARHVAGILAREREQAPPGAKVFLGGISQGGATALYLTARKFVGTFLDGTDASGVPVDGTVCFCGWMASDTAKALTQAGLHAPTPAAQYPILYCHGEADPLITCGLGRRSAQALQTLGFSALDFRTYPDVVHFVSQQEKDAMAVWLDNLIGPVAPGAGASSLEQKQSLEEDLSMEEEQSLELQQQIL